jgi:cytochrome c oxidase subunit 4
MKSSSGAATYVGIWAAVVILAALSLGLSFAPLGRFGAPVALMIALAKASLIAAVFMELREQPPISRWAFGFGIALLMLLLVLVAIDELTRPRLGISQPGMNGADGGQAVERDGGARS